MNKLKYTNLNKKLSKKYHLNIYNTNSKEYPYYVKDWEDFYETIEEIEDGLNFEFKIANINV